MIDFHDVHYAYPGENRILDGLNFSIKAGERVALIGANGVGKSTILKAMLGLIEVEGDIVINKLSMTKKNISDIRKCVGYVLQDSDNQMFMPKVIDDVMFGLINYGISREEAEKKANDTLKRLGIEHLKDKHNYKISVGEKKMAAIATVLAMEPEVILLDEPSASLDPSNRRKIINTLNDLKMTKIIATHDLDMALETCDRVLLLGNGKIVADGVCEEILSDKKLMEDNNLELPFCMAGLKRG